MNMNDNDKSLMEKYDITSMTRTEYLYKDMRYGSLANAVMYAKHEAKKLAQKPSKTTRY